MPASSVASTSVKLTSNYKPNSRVRNILNKSAATPASILDITSLISVNDISVNTDGLSEKSKNLVACKIQGVASHFEEAINKRDKMYETRYLPYKSALIILKNTLTNKKTINVVIRLCCRETYQHLQILTEKLTKFSLTVKNDISISHRLEKKTNS